MVDKSSFRDFVKSELSHELVSHLVNGINKSYAESHQHVFDTFDREQALDLLPYDRRTRIESFLRLLPNQFPEVKVDCRSNLAFNAYHVEIEVNKIIITQSYCKTPDEKIREAKFRNSLSEFNIQEKFSFVDDLPYRKQDKYYAILRHGAENRDPIYSNFFNLYFPSTNSENAVDAIDLYKLYKLEAFNLTNGIEPIESKDTLTKPAFKHVAKVEGEEL